MAEIENARIVVTGGAGYIGSHVALSLLESGAQVFVIDDFSNSSPAALARVRALAGQPVESFAADLSDWTRLDEIKARVRAFSPTGAVHLAGLKAVGESVADPLRYYAVNIDATLNLLAALQPTDARAIVFSSSATVYGDANESPISEDGATHPMNPYGRTKLIIEELLRDLAAADPKWRVCNLRYFNPVGAHPSGRIGEDPQGAPNNLFPYIAQVAVGRRDRLTVFGDDYPTADGTGVRDYLHVCDLADGHVRALAHLMRAGDGAPIDLNLGTGVGVSVLEALAAFERACGRRLPHVVADRRQGDVATLYADPSRAQTLLGWRAEKTLDEMCADHWRWQSANPQGYADSDG